MYKEWDYVVHGTVFEIKEEKDKKIHIGISFGGLLMALKGDRAHLSKIHNDEKIFCFLRSNN